MSRSIRRRPGTGVSAAIWIEELSMIPPHLHQTAASVIGRPLPRAEGRAKVTGACPYTADIFQPGALWGKFLRSPLPHARILTIDTAKAKKVAGVKAVIAGGDVSPRLEGYTLQDKPILARGKVLYCGEKVAAVAAVDKDAAEEAASLIEVDYEELPAVFDPLQAMEERAPRLHPEYASYLGPASMAPDLKNVQSVVRAAKGDIERGFTESDEIFENTFRTQMVHQGFIEPRACLVAIDREGRVEVWFCHQASFKVRRWMAVHLGISEEKIIVYPVALGGSFGGKEGYEEALCTYYLAAAAGKPVKVVETYAEELLDGEPRHAAIVKLRTGVKKDGRLWAWEGKIFYNGGAYAARKPSPKANMSGTFMLAGSYNIPHTLMEGYAIYTNQIPCGYFRAPGEPQTLFAVESHIDMIAEALGLDALEFRLKNVLRRGDTRATGEPLSDPRGDAALSELGKICRWKKPLPPAKRGKLRGRGLALGDRHVGHGESSAEIYLERDGAVRLVTSVRDQGVGAYTMHRQVAAETLGIEPGLIQVEIKGTADGPYDEGVRGARGAHVEGQAVLRAAGDFIECLRRQAAAYWRVDISDVEWQAGRAWLLNGRKSKSLGLEEIARMIEAPLKGCGHYKAEKKPSVYSFQAIAADVEVDVETGAARVEKLYFTYDVTKVINPVIHQGQIDGAVVQGLGFSLMEEMAVDEGRVLTLSLGDYKIPNIKDVPPLVTSLVQANEGPGPFGVKAVAEAGISIVAPAIANAIYNATGVRITDLPVTAEKILAGLARRSGKRLDRQPTAILGTVGSKKMERG
jgi:CO/xanthine dehydrogenase Mo-binding subunit